MGIICNGAQRSGTHMLLETVASAGYRRRRGLVRQRSYDPKNKRAPRIISLSVFLSHFRFNECVVGHMHYPATLRGHRMILIVRDPRDWVVSVARYRQRTTDMPSPGALLNAMCRLPVLWWFYPWLECADLVVRFEDLRRCHKPTLCKVAGLVGGDEHAMAAAIRAGSRTWTGRVSDHRQVFDAKTERAFKRNGGRELVTAYGYHT